MKKLIFLALLFLFYPKPVSAQTSSDWYMLGANPQRTSWVSEEVRGNLNVEWYRPIEPYIPYKVQPIFSNGNVYISTSKGLYAFKASDGSQLWVYPTELPLGHSPTVINNVAYVGGYDRKIHAIDANTGQAITGYTPYIADAGFETNPLVVNGVIYAGNRDGYFYALNATTGGLIWKFKTDGPILFSAAYKDNTLYFASNDSYAYAVNTNGQQVWKSTKLQGQGFHTYWPVIYTDKQNQKDYVIFSGAENYRYNAQNVGNLHSQEGKIFFPECFVSNSTCPWGNLIGEESIAPNDGYWTSGTHLIDISKINTYYENQPYRRTVFVLDRQTGQEYTFDSNGNSLTEYAPFAFSGTTKSGNKYPPIINGIDQIYYQHTTYASAPWIVRGDVVGWRPGTHFVSRVANLPIAHAVDEPMAFSSGGKLIYWSLCCDRDAGVFDVTIPYGQANRNWNYYNYNLLTLIPDYDPLYNDGDTAVYNSSSGFQVYSGNNLSKNGIYGKHGTGQSPPIPYQGRVYMLRGNTLIAWDSTPVRTGLPLVSTHPISNGLTPENPSEVQTKLAEEIQKMLAAGHLRPGYHASGVVDSMQISFDRKYTLGEILDYFQNPADTVATLIDALPYLSTAMQNQVKTYLQTNYGPGAPYDFVSIAHVGWNTGASREAFEFPPDLWTSQFANFGKLNTSWCKASMVTATCCNDCYYWQGLPPFNFYAAWKYAKVFGNTRTLFDSIKTKIEAPPTNTDGTVSTEFILKPYFLNQYLAGYLGYLELEKLAGYPESTNVRNWYNLILNARINQFSKDTPYWPNAAWGLRTDGGNNWRSLSIASNFMFLTSEVADILSQNLLTQMQTAVEEYEYVASYWFVSKFDNMTGEGTLDHLYNPPALFQAKAYILKEPYEELVKYLDVPAFAVGDLFYIQNLVAALSASNSKPGDLNLDGQVDVIDIRLILSDFGTKYSIFDLSIVISNFGK